MKIDEVVGPHLVAQFWAAPPEALFSQRTLAAALDRAESWFEQARVKGTGPAFRKVAGRILYCKSDVLAWLDAHKRVTRTSQLAA
jgi:hypothetical protein